MGRISTGEKREPVVKNRLDVRNRRLMVEQNGETKQQQRPTLRLLASELRDETTVSDG